MATIFKRIEFKQRYPGIKQGLFILLSEKRVPKGQKEINIGKALSLELCSLPESERPTKVSQILFNIVSNYSALTLTHIEILFSPELNLDAVRLLLSVCRNRKVCIIWPGAVKNGRLYYATPDYPDYYECDPNILQDTYIVVD